MRVVAVLIPILSLAVGCPRPPPVVALEKEELAALPDVPVPAPRTRSEAVADLVANFERVHFEVDQAVLGPDARDALEANAALLVRYPDLTVEVQGHADERGTIDYNMALGQRRANAVVSFLASRGVSANRLPILSYGEERPLQLGTSETAWAANRRAEFRVIEGAATVAGTTNR